MTILIGMKYESPLTNPDPKDFGQDESKDNQSLDQVGYNTQKSPRQLSLGNAPILYRIKNYFTGTLHVLRRRNDMFQLDMIWKSPAIPFAIISALFISITTLAVTIIKFNDIPPQLRFFYNNIDKTWFQVDKSALIAYPLILIFIEILVIHFITVIFRTDKRFAKTLAWILTIVNTMILISLMQLFNLIFL